MAKLSATLLATTPSLSTPVRALCLHGWRTNANLMRLQTRQLLAAFPPGAIELEHVNAPFTSKKPADPSLGRLVAGPFHEWWDTIEEGGSNDQAHGFSSDAKVVSYNGLDQSIDTLCSFIRNEAAKGRAFDVVIGFSQGGILTTILTALMERGAAALDQPPFTKDSFAVPCGESLLPPSAAWKAVVLVSTMMPRDTELRSTTCRTPSVVNADTECGDRLLDIPLETPSCHIFGEADNMFPASEGLAKWWSGKECTDAKLILTHTAGHRFPPAGNQRLYEKTAEFVLRTCSKETGSFDKSRC